MTTAVHQVTQDSLTISSGLQRCHRCRAPMLELDGQTAVVLSRNHGPMRIAFREIRVVCQRVQHGKVCGAVNVFSCGIDVDFSHQG